MGAGVSWSVLLPWAFGFLVDGKRNVNSGQANSQTLGGRPLVIVHM
jgi:hypothetical protein